MGRQSWRWFLLTLIVGSGCSENAVIPLPPTATSELVVWLLQSSDGTGFATLPTEILNFPEEDFVSISQVELPSAPLCEGFVKDELRPVVFEGTLVGSNAHTWMLGGDEWAASADLNLSLVPPVSLRSVSNPRLAPFSAVPLLSGSGVCTDLMAVTPVDSSGRQEYLQFGLSTQTSTFCRGGILDVSLRTGEPRMLRISGPGTPGEICNAGGADLTNRLGHLSDDGSPDYAYQLTPNEWRVVGCPDATVTPPRWLESIGVETRIVTGNGMYSCVGGDLELIDPTVRAADSAWIATASAVYVRQPGAPLTVPAGVQPVLELSSCTDCQAIVALRAYLGGVAVLASAGSFDRRVAWVNAEGDSTPFVDVGLVARVAPHDGFLLGLNSSGVQVSLHPGW